MTLAAIFMVVGLALLTAGADRAVAAAARLSQAWGVSPVLVGALIVGLGTSAPELLVSAIAAIRGDLDLSIGNVVGSNLSNVTLVLGATAMLMPLVARARTLRREGVLMLVSVAAMAGVLWDLNLGRLEAGVLGAAMIVASVLLVLWARNDPLAVPEGAEPGFPPPIGGRREIVIGLLALGATLAGADLLVRGAERLVEEVGIDAAFVGLVVVAVGTSLPELATSLAAARRREAELVVGNVLGSNLFNSLAVVATAGLARPGPVAAEFRPALVWMLAAVAAAGLLLTTGRRLVRAEGALLLAAFAAFVAFSAA